jgi:Fic family protein
VTFDRDRPFDALPPLPPAVAVETPRVLKKAIAANRMLAELKGVARSMPNQGILIQGLVLQEARASSEIESIVTTNDELFRAASDEAAAVSPETREVLRYRQALRHGFEALAGTPLCTRLFVEIVRIIKQSDVDVRRIPGTRIIDGAGAAVYTPPAGEALIRQHLSSLERFIHDDADGLDPLVKLALIHYQFEAIHPFPDGNGRTGRIVNILYLVQRGLIDVPVLYLSRYVIEHKAAYYEGLRRVTEEGAWEDWVLYMLDAVEQTSIRTQDRIRRILELMDAVRARVQSQAPSIYSKDLIESIFRHPYCKIQFLERDGLGTRQTCSKYLRELEALGVLRSVRPGREVYYLNEPLMALLTE